jgi:hypothetical protein
LTNPEVSMESGQGGISRRDAGVLKITTAAGNRHRHWVSSKRW